MGVDVVYQTFSHQVGLVHHATIPNPYSVRIMAWILRPTACLMSTPKEECCWYNKHTTSKCYLAFISTRFESRFRLEVEMYIHKAFTEL